MHKYLTYSLMLGILWFGLWFTVHIPAIFYGTQDIPLHQSYIGDEQSPVNGALHVLADKNPLAVRNLTTLYYGPIFAMVALPAVVGDFAEKYVTGSVQGAESYKNSILWDWGGIVWKARVLSITVSFLGLLACYALLMTKTVNPQGRRWLALVGTLVLATNFYFFEYASFFRHWAFLVSGLLGQVYIAVRIFEDGSRTKQYLIYQAALFFVTFGISYVSALSQIVLLPFAFRALATRDWRTVRLYSYYGIALVAMIGLIATWHPHAFLRILGLAGGDVTNTDTSQWTSEIQVVGYSFGYYGYILIVNQLALIALWVGLGIRALRTKLEHTYIWLIPMLPAVVWFIVFGSISHHESRYILPVVAMLIVSTMMLWIRQLPDMQRTVVRGSFVLVVFTLVFHIATIVRWEYALLQQPIERHAIAEAVAYQEAHPGSKQLFVQYYLLGWPHTNEAYRDYMDRFGKSETNLYHELLAAPKPEGSIPLNVYYMRPDRFEDEKERLHEFDRIVFLYEPDVELDLEPDYLEVDLARIWFADDVQNTYSVLKE